MRLTPALPWAITVPATSITASSWAWGLGEAGVIATAGAGIASAAKVEETTTADLAAQPIAVTVGAQLAVVDTMPAQVEVVLQRAAAHLNLVVAVDNPMRFTPRGLIAVVDLAAAVADIKAVEVGTKVVAGTKVAAGTGKIA